MGKAAATHAGVAWSEDEDDWLRENYVKLRSSELARELGRSAPAVTWRMRLLGLRVPAKVLRQRLVSDRRARAAAYGHRKWGEYATVQRRLKYGRMWPGCGTSSEVRVCRALREAGRLTAGGLALAIGLSSPESVRKTLARLVRDGMACREWVSGAYEYWLADRPGARMRRAN